MNEFGSESGNPSGSCPKCQNNLGDSFGLAKCSRCGCLVFIEFDGSVKMADHHSASSTETKKAQTVSKSFSFGKTNEPTASNKTGIFDLESSDQPSKERDENLNLGAAAFSPGDWASESNESPKASSDFGGSTDLDLEVAITSETDNELDLEESPENETVAWDPMGGGMDSENDRTRVLGEKSIADISRFSNSEVSGANQGPVLYNLVIRKIDSADIKTNVSEVLSDSRLNLDMISVIEQIRKGQVSLRNLNPVKVHVVVKGLQAYGVEVEWSQQSVLEAVK